MKLTAMICHEGLALPGLRASNTMTLTIGEGPLRDWRVHVRGPSVFLVSPRGWEAGKQSHEYKGSVRRIYEVPRNRVSLSWDLDESTSDSLDDVVKWSPAVDAVADIAAETVDAALALPRRGRPRKQEEAPE